MGHYFADKAVLRTQLRLPFGHRKDLGIDFAAELLLSAVQSVDKGAEVRLADDQKIDVTARGFTTARRRAEDERYPDVTGQRCERFDQDVGQADRLPQNAGQLWLDLVRAVRRVLNLIADTLAIEQPRLVQTHQLLVERSGRRPRQARDLAYVQASFRV